MTFALRFSSANAAFYCTPADGDDRSATSGGMPPADAIMTLFSSLTLRWHELRSRCTRASSALRSPRSGLVLAGYSVARVRHIASSRHTTMHIDTCVAMKQNKKRLLNRVSSTP